MINAVSTGDSGNSHRYTIICPITNFSFYMQGYKNEYGNPVYGNAETYITYNQNSKLLTINVMAATTWSSSITIYY